MFGDGSGLTISHTGLVSLSTPTKNFILSIVLCVPFMKNNLISVSQFCKFNQTFIEFFPGFFILKDLHTGPYLVCSQKKHDVYEWPSTIQSSPRQPVTPTACVSIKVPPDIWHGRLGHPSPKITNYLARFNPCVFVVWNFFYLFLWVLSL